MAGFDADGAREAFELPDGVRPSGDRRVGSLGDYADVAPEIAERDALPRERLALDEIVFNGRGRPMGTRAGQAERALTHARLRQRFGLRGDPVVEHRHLDRPPAGPARRVPDSRSPHGPTAAWRRTGVPRLGQLHGLGQQFWVGDLPGSLGQPVGPLLVGRDLRHRRNRASSSPVFAAIILACESLKSSISTNRSAVLCGRARERTSPTRRPRSPAAR